MRLTVFDRNQFAARILSFLWLLLLSANELCALNLPARWRWSNPGPHGANVIDSAYMFGLTVQVAEQGQIFTSEDLIFWEPRDTGTTRALRGVTLFGNRP